MRESHSMNHKKINEKTVHHSSSTCKLHLCPSVYVSPGNLCITRASAKLFTHWLFVLFIASHHIASHIRVCPPVKYVCVCCICFVSGQKYRTFSESICSHFVFNTQQQLRCTPHRLQKNTHSEFLHPNSYWIIGGWMCVCFFSSAQQRFFSVSMIRLASNAKKAQI